MKYWRALDPNDPEPVPKKVIFFWILIGLLSLLATGRSGW